MRWTDTEYHAFLTRHPPRPAAPQGDDLPESDDATPATDIHVHVHTARERLRARLAHLATRHAEEATNGP